MLCLALRVLRLSAKAKEQGSKFYQASITTAASTAEGIKRLALGEPLQVCLCVRVQLAAVPAQWWSGAGCVTPALDLRTNIAGVCAFPY